MVDPTHLLLYSFISSCLIDKFIEIQFCVWPCQLNFPALQQWRVATEWVSYFSLPETTRSIYFLLKKCIWCVHVCIFVHLSHSILVEDNLEDLRIKFRLSGLKALIPWAISPALALLFERMPASSGFAYSEHSPVHLRIVGRVIDLDIL